MYFKIPDDPTEKCILSNWSKFSKCSISCGNGFKERTRSILVSIILLVISLFNKMLHLCKLKNTYTLQSPVDPLEQKACRKKLVDRRACRGRQCISKFKQHNTNNMMYLNLKKTN